MEPPTSPDAWTSYYQRGVRRVRRRRVLHRLFPTLHRWSEQVAASAAYLRCATCGATAPGVRAPQRRPETARLRRQTEIRLAK